MVPENEVSEGLKSGSVEDFMFFDKVSGFYQ